jgi:hypothetical protein
MRHDSGMLLVLLLGAVLTLAGLCSVVSCVAADLAGVEVADRCG